jgi:hypothetical protein
MAKVVHAVSIAADLDEETGAEIEEMKAARDLWQAKHEKDEEPDIVGFVRDEAWTQYACKSPAAFAYAFARSGHVRPRGAQKRKNPIRRGASR